ncbi:MULTISPECIES: histidine phosphatase family protein [Okeania]|uniref:Histidine phosphatase family protein n=1 Tax=Okeania hirsuta TaxID=1458930 RepID=A0A3N6P019_9CYAN|nr:MULTISPECIES: histidine phosphatase family protein [Okeania]NET13667.1 histidine phosphatase family protein [Okeania sp. SIO1H6]NES74478.1 histidine phosphatase family protein [Okeania sp. SIO1H4]NES90257.1 histidine phosphatase family protein [Okeania sp. SIO2B9]NET18037.1 histidine phosphatase family protein [Okeania sp. SIO1H5]NET76351.1 histidine phosphatase family protein [Okeania sp. SIO1F9]
MSTRVILVRHGQSTYNVERRIQGRLDVSILTDIGINAARQVGEALKGLKFDAIYASPLKRAKQTAEIIHSCLNSPPPLQSKENLREVDLPLWEGMLRQEVKDKFGEDYRIWSQLPHEFYMEVSTPEGQIKHFPVLSLFDQAKQFWQETLSQNNDKTILVVAHNGINRCLIATALEIQPSFYQSIQQSNCGISILNFTPPFPSFSGEDKSGGSVQLESMNLTTHIGEKFPKPREKHQGPRLLLVRHGETNWNRDGKFQGQIDVPLNDNGRLQGGQAAEFLKDVHLDFAVSSSMSRPKETAEIILQHHPDVELQLDDGLWEISHGLWEGKFESEIESGFPGLLKQWKEFPETVQMPEGENLQQVWERAMIAWQKIIRSVSGVGIVVAHDAINKAILCQLFGLEPKHFWNFKQGNGAVSVIDYPQGPDGQAVLEAMNITSHLSGGILDKTAAGAL